jgi:hypothetical protein
MALAEQLDPISQVPKSLNLQIPTPAQSPSYPVMDLPASKHYVPINHRSINSYFGCVVYNRGSLSRFVLLLYCILKAQFSLSFVWEKTLDICQYCGSEMFIQDPNSSRIQGQKDSGSRIRIRIKEFKYF